MNKVNKLFYEIYWFFKNLFRRRKPNKVGSKSEMDLNDYDDNEHAYVVSPLFVHCSDNDIDNNREEEEQIVGVIVVNANDDDVLLF